MARLATEKAKPDGYFVVDGDVKDFVSTCELADIPGIGKVELSVSDLIIVGDIG